MKRRAYRTSWAIAALTIAFVFPGAHVRAQNPAYRMMEDWARVPQGFTWGQIISVDVDVKGDVYVLQRCSSNTCVDRSEPPLVKFDAAGRQLWSWGAGKTVYPHGMDIDRHGNIWLTDAQDNSGKGQQVFKLSPDGKVLMTIGMAGVAGDGQYTFNGVADIEVADNGDIFVADGHVNNRIVKYSPDGKYIAEWGRKGIATGEFNMPHALAMDSQGRLFVGDRDNYRIQIFDQNGRFIDEWRQFGRPSGIYIDANDNLYVAAQNTKVNQDMVRGLYIGSARDGSVKSIIPNFNAESIAADRGGAIYSGQRVQEGRQQESEDALLRFVPVDP